MAIRKYLFILLILIDFSSPGQSGSLDNFGKASYYHDMFHGRLTSNGEIYDKDDFTAAHLTLPFNTILLITNKKNNKSVVVRINDRGPFKKSRFIDLSHSAAKKIGMVPFGVVQVKIKVLNFLNPSLMNDDLLNDGDIWDCYGNRKTQCNTSIYLWKTVNWKHAFYMASCLSLEYKLKSVDVKVNGTGKRRVFELYINELKDIASRNKFLTELKTDGFFHAEIINRNSSKARQPSGQ